MYVCTCIYICIYIYIYMCVSYTFDHLSQFPGATPPCRPLRRLPLAVYSPGRGALRGFYVHIVFMHIVLGNIYIFIYVCIYTYIYT